MLLPIDLPCGGPVDDARPCLRSDDRNPGVCGTKRFDLGLCKVARTNDDARPSSDLQKNGEEIHEINLLPRRKAASPDGCSIALDGVDGLPGQLSAKAVVVGTRKVSAKVLLRLTIGEIAA
jgi:hypothetical protein